ncbi:MAG: DarT ssDNA thymidine ADP-ribosyltransferase family protein [Vicinamibacterales bacterium]
MTAASRGDERPDPLNRITVLYHFTDRRNLAMIRELGGLFAMAALREKGISVPAPGGNQWSQDADGMRGMDQYVHLCFRSTHPMEFRAREEGRIQDSIFLQVHPEVLQWEGVRFTPDVSNKSGVNVHTIDEARALIDFQVLYTRTDWRDPAIQQRLAQAEKCEVLVPTFIPLDLIRNFPNG